MNYTLRKISAPIAAVCLAVAPGCYATEYFTIEQAQQVCFPTATKFVEEHVLFTEEQKKLIESASGVSVNANAQKIWKVVGAESVIGWFVVDYVIGKHLLIDYAVAVDINGLVKEVEILAYRESYGGEVKEQRWLSQFRGKSKNSALALYDDITNISGATLSSRSVTEGIKRILATLDVTKSKK